MSRYKKWKKLIIIAGTLAVVLALACDMRLKTVFYTVEAEKISQPVRIALLTDLHSDWYGKNQSTLISAVDDQKPDIVLLGGDIFDDKGTYEYAEITLKQLAEKYPCYYVTGNHEYWSRDIDNILGIVESCGIPALSGDCHTVEINGQMINICGVDDPDVIKYTENGKPITEQLKLAEETADSELFTILLSHRPELKEMYEEYNFDLVLSGHAHGGQWRIPFLLNGLYAPNQGLFPEYAGGRYDYENGTLLVSRGLARESTPIPRIFNRPELVIVDIR
ncbi:MAG: metallophosphoesterase [Lachnospiraceae bacterium]|nr:metallophosphoesterase [Lachnospiraceae bacterium]